ncbi:acylphosphatase [Hymenobacter gelipurpurascens]|uniref:acylphosphatase n=1 Tax=Hymenobacter gelipurpurascens TaxID=89968 RepID=A0A212TQ66_9BACT|nr:acylphosphatase [Hymenobacter gelipurpurascens]SNC68050.1 acylphosphatase [Hymenobacter gelipurpurascens]
MSIEHRSIRVHGQVQGVFYRQSTRHEARRLGLRGTVCNNPDGTVSIEAEGPAEALDALQAWCQQGPPAAHVTKVESASGPVEGYTAFEVKREA